MKSRLVNLKTIPFSCFGSFFVLSVYEENGEEVLYLRDIRGGDFSPGKQFKIEFLAEYENNRLSTVPLADIQIVAAETLLTFTYNMDNKTASVRMCFEDEDTIRICGENMGIRMRYLLKKYDNIYSEADGKWTICSYSKELKYDLHLLEGKTSIDAPWERIGNSRIELEVTGNEAGVFDFAVESYRTVCRSRENGFLKFEQACALMEDKFKKWCDSIGRIPEGHEAGALEAGYITWVNFVKAEGKIPYPAMYMTKNWMTNVWSWDNCFGAIFLSKAHPQLAYEQLMMFVQVQAENGVYPDYLNETYASYSCTKPPIYGWTYDYLVRENEFFEQDTIIEEFYQTICKQTNFWLKHRMSRMGLPYYTHGNDSGWDNGTFFSKGIPVIAPDLAGFLIYQTECLSRLAGRLNNPEDEIKWKEKSEELLALLQEKLWDGERFRAYLPRTDEWISEGDTLQAFLPIIIGGRLQPEILEKMLEALKDTGKFNCNFGLATEAADSELYEYNGYWRGPVWAPVMLIFIESLFRAGEAEFARNLAVRFLRAPSENGMSENFDPVTGEGLVDTGFAWTSAVYLTLLRDEKVLKISYNID